MNVIEIDNVTKKYKNFSMDHLNLNIKQGFVTGFIGRNGAGKSTTLDMIMNLVPIDSGDIKIFGLDFKMHEKEIKDRIGFVDDSNIFFENFNIQNIVKIISNAYSNWSQQTFNNYVKKFDLPTHKKIKSFSKGMKMKLSIAVALSHDAKLLIMDEPTSGLDPVVRREIIDIFRNEMIDETRSILFSTHITEDLEKIADYIVLIHNGEIVFNQSIHDINSKYKTVKGHNDLLDADTEQYFISIKRDHSTFEALTERATEVEAVFKDSVVIEQTKLDDILYFLNGDENNG